MIRTLLATAIVGLGIGGAAVPTLAQSQPEPYTIEIPQERLDEVISQVREHEFLPDTGLERWRFGVPQSWLAEMGAHWAEDYDWRAAEARLNRFDNFRAEIDGKQLHFIHERGSGDNPTPLLILHGWPYSVYSFIDVIEPLAHPERFGGDAADAFDVVVVSIPGVGFSEATDEPESLRSTGRRYHKLMTEVLGYDRYITHGGDQGALSAGWMAYDYPDAVMGHHTHMHFPRHASSPWLSGKIGAEPTEAEKAWIEAEAAAPFGQLAYILTHVARGETLAASLADNPVGQAAWIWDKWYYWTDKSGAAFEEIHTKDRLIDEVMYYILTDSFRTSLWPYLMLGVEENAVLPEGEVIANPAGVTAWPDPVFPLPPREYVERSRPSLIHYTTPARGGHFPMVEVPELYVEDLRTFRRSLAEHLSAPDGNE
ncbi:epoxide hydrolase family protein [uncultured Roseobacter sp.]|uniref:epoxide hydrolase family protein n=1 Tax=uncultured Roseobacter sp. TaxID=114847 RepID=UPI00260D1843|nr:epoxide hydrolase family protein [uncultured Roseobacter sp.]